MARTADTTNTGDGNGEEAKAAAKKRKSRAKPTNASSDPTVEQPLADAVSAAKADTPAAPAKSGGGWIFALVVLSLIAGGGYITRTKWMPLVADKLQKIPGLKTEDPRVAELSQRLAALENKTGALAVKDETIQRLEKEREKLSADLAKALTRLETVERSMANVRQIAEAAAQVDEASQAKESLKRLGDRLAAIESSGAVGADKQSVATGLAELKAAEARSRELAERLNKLEKDQAAMVPAEKVIAGVEQRLQEIEKSAVKRGGARAALVLAVGQLRDAVQRGGAFERELQAVKGMAAGDPGISATLLPLGSFAKTGVPTLVMLRDEFAGMAGTIVARAGSGGGGWLDGLTRRLGSLIHVRRIDGAGSDSVEGLVARAEKQLATGDLAGAITAIEGVKPLSAVAADTAKPWLARAKMRAGAERALAALHIHAVSLLDAAKE